MSYLVPLTSVNQRDASQVTFRLFQEAKRAARWLSFEYFLISPFWFFEHGILAEVLAG